MRMCRSSLGKMKKATTLQISNFLDITRTMVITVLLVQETIESKTATSIIEFLKQQTSTGMLKA